MSSAPLLLELGKPVTVSDTLAVAILGLGSLAYLAYGIPWDRPDPYHHVWFTKPQDGEGSKVEQVHHTRNIAEKMEQSNKNMVLFWGSQSGTAEMLANKLARECQTRFDLNVLVADLSDYDAKTISEIPASKTAIFILSTFGEGNPSDNTVGLWTWIRDLSGNQLRDLRYIAFGLGNSTYKYYNQVVNVVTESFDRAGAKCLMPVGRADDSNGGTEEDFLAWREDLFVYFKTQLSLQEREIAYTPAFEVTEDPTVPESELNYGVPINQQSAGSKGFTYYSPIKPVTLTSAEELYHTSDRHCVCLEFDLADQAELRYKTGDHLALYPSNPEAEVRNLVRSLGMEGRQEVPLKLQSIREDSKLPNPTTLAALFTHYLEICAPLSRDTVRQLIQFSPTPEAASFLKSISNSREAFSDFVGKNHVTIGRLLSLVAPDVSWAKLPLSFLLEVIPLLQPRYYSVSSSAMVSPRKISITVGIVNRTLKGAPEVNIRGLTSNYALSLAMRLKGAQSPWPASDLQQAYALEGPRSILDGRKAFVRIRKSRFKLPTTPSTPIIMIAAGTGLAPFRGFILERVRLQAIGKPVGPMILFFGCRRPDHDFLYREELYEAAQALGDNLDIRTAFSRSTAEPKRYVQDCIREDGHRICDLLEKDANLYICGRAAMAKEVGAVIQEAMTTYRNGDQSKAGEWSESIKRGGKWLEDVWG
ncbi:uncharacterized protein NECHADRAFT_98095 [Fusarium vanettenii 77-13-4]|uniref:NADPH--cytochrome P450 reductase n=1 Tax=Fusarium vanettenii (strain ATCC MYA-4622 / CBS 123669 / FGSC 9596 / NRRL 45880 / 77-13-4) TaxID=660122 RepID=C7ZM79_FUSV7|nr:uncharacterized protein NECHADRAFT_98095 [Fusarium vanettenii 77-13-4]EEU34866.1 hypothetical protein NECHADRAFT_98095 [Fusarium vanettenii 77-13-4]